ncbi:MAG: type IV pilus assembly protein PilM, partial [Pseudomonadota bacterium]
MGVSRLIGLDIGSSSVKMVEIDRAKKGYELVFAGIAHLPDGTVADKEIKKADAVTHSLKELHKNSKSKTKRVSTSIAGRAVIIKMVTMTSMTDAQLEKQIQMEAEPYIPFDIKEVVLDYFIMGDRPEREGQMDVVLVAARKAYVNEYLQLIKDVGFQPSVVDVDPFALEVMYETCYPTEQEEVVGLVNVGASTINVNI